MLCALRLENDKIWYWRVNLVGCLGGSTVRGWWGLSQTRGCALFRLGLGDGWLGCRNVG